MRTALTRQESIHAANGRCTEERSCLRNITKVMEMKAVENPDMTPAIISHLQNWALIPLSENQYFIVSMALI